MANSALEWTRPERRAADRVRPNHLRLELTPRSSCTAMFGRLPSRFAWGRHTRDV